jgi:hypothetical protein
MRDVTPLLDSLGRALSLDMASFASCRRSRSINGLVESDIQQASSAGVRSTPSFLVGDFLVQGASPYAGLPPRHRHGADRRQGQGEALNGIVAHSTPSERSPRARRCRSRPAAMARSPDRCARGVASSRG